MTNACDPLLLQRLRYGCIMVFTYGSGIGLLLYVWSIVILLQQSPRRPLWGATLTFLSTSLVVNSVYFGLIQKITEVAFLEFHGVPDPTDYKSGTPICSGRAVAASILSTISILLNDGFFMFRASKIFEQQYAGMLLPSILYFSLLVVGLVSSMRCSLDLTRDLIQIMPILFDALSVALNVLLAIMVIQRLRRVAYSSRRYLSIIGIITESTLAWALFGLLFTVARIINNPTQEIFRSFFEITGGLSTATLIFRLLANMHYCREPASGQITHGKSQSIERDLTHSCSCHVTGGCVIERGQDDVEKNMSCEQ